MYLKTKGPKKRTGESVDSKTEKVGRRSVVYQLEMQLCGKPGCSKLHGPYWSAYWIHNGRQCKRYIGRVFRRPTLDQFRTIERRAEAKTKAAKVGRSGLAAAAPRPRARDLRRKPERSSGTQKASRDSLRRRASVAPKATKTAAAVDDPRQLSIGDALRALGVEVTATTTAAVVPSSVAVFVAPLEDEREPAVSTPA